MDRRDFIKAAGAGVAAAGIAACAPSKKEDSVNQISNLDKGPEAMLQHYPGVGVLGYGCMRWQMKKDENGNDIIDQDSVNELVDYAIAHGVNYFDSAPVYLQGKSEEATAKALLRHPRESYLIATKMSNFRGSHRFEEDVKLYHKSLEYYQTDHLDYYLLHSLSGMEALKSRFLDNGLLDYLLKEREAGHIRNLGFSFHGPKEGFDELVALHEKYHWDFVQIQLNYVDWKYASRDAKAEYMYNVLAEKDIPAVIMEPLLGGGLSNVPAPVADLLKAKEPQRSIASWAFRFAGSFPKILTVLSGMTYMEHLQDNLNTFLDYKPLTEEDYALLQHAADLLHSFPLIDCTGCQYCMPCPYGIDIPGVFKFYNDSVKEGTYIENAEQEHYAKAKRDYLLKYDKAIPTVRQADHCIACGQCLPKCPQHIRIPKELQKIDSYINNLKQDKL